MVTLETKLSKKYLVFPKGMEADNLIGLERGGVLR